MQTAHIFFCILVFLDYVITLKWRFSVSPLRSSRKPPVFLTKEKIFEHGGLPISQQNRDNKNAGSKYRVL